MSVLEELERIAQELEFKSISDLLRIARIGAEAEAKVKQCQRFNRFDCCEEYCRLYEVCKMVKEGAEND